MPVKAIRTFVPSAFDDPLQQIYHSSSCHCSTWTALAIWLQLAISKVSQLSIREVFWHTSLTEIPQVLGSLHGLGSNSCVTLGQWIRLCSIFVWSLGLRLGICLTFATQPDCRNSGYTKRLRASRFHFHPLHQHSGKCTANVSSVYAFVWCWEGRGILEVLTLFLGPSNQLRLHIALASVRGSATRRSIEATGWECGLTWLWLTSQDILQHMFWCQEEESVWLQVCK